MGVDVNAVVDAIVVVVTFTSGCEEDGLVWQTGKNEVGVGARRGQAAVQCGLNIAPSTHAASRPAWLSRLPPDKSCLHVHPAILQSGKETISSNSK